MTVPSAGRAADENTRDTLQAALDIFNRPCSTAVPEGGRQRLRELSEKQKQAAARAAVLVSGGSGQVPEAELRGVTSALEQSTIAMCSYVHGFTSGAGPSLVASLKTLCAAVVTPTQELAAKLATGDSAEIRRAVGLVWSACDELAGGPLDNKACLFRQLADVMTGVKAAAKELDELVESSRQELAASAGTNAREDEAAPGAARPDAADGEAADASAAPDGADGAADCDGADPSSTGRGGAEQDEDGDGDDEEEEEEDSDDFREMGTLSAGELRTAETAAGLLAAAQAALRAVSRPLLEGPAVGPDQCLDEWESMAWHGAKLRSSCEALVACLYPPHDDEEELQGSCEAIANTLELMLEEFPLPEAGAEAEAGPYGGEAVRSALEAARAQAEAAAGRLQDALARAAGAVA